MLPPLCIKCRRANRVKGWPMCQHCMARVIDKAMKQARIPSNDNPSRKELDNADDQWR